MPVLDIRGTHGSGKSWLMHKLMKDYGKTPIKREGKIHGYALNRLDAAIIGRYTWTCGGCDTMGSPALVEQLIIDFLEHYQYVLLEGILVSHTYKRYAKLATVLKDYRFLFLNTPLELCLMRVQERPRVSLRGKPFEDKNVRKDYAVIHQSVRKKLTQSGFYVRILPYLDPYPILLEELSK